MAPPTGPSLNVEPIPLGKIYSSPHQMRKHFDKASLQELARSMKQEGLIQPVSVRVVGNAYELVAGERRFRAAQLLGWDTIEARILDVSDEDAAIKGLIENLQRADLNPLEEARGYKQLVQPPYNMTQDAIAQRVGKGQTVIARSLALLELPSEIQELLPRGIITETHTRALRKLTDRFQQIEIARRAHREGWTVKETERRVKEALAASGKPMPRRKTQGRTPGMPDPLAELWARVVDPHADVPGVRRITYEGGATWTFHVDASGSAPRQTLADILVRLGYTLSGPLPGEPSRAVPAETNDKKPSV